MVARVFTFERVLELTPAEIQWWYIRTERAKAEDRLAFLSDVQTAVASLLADKKSGNLQQVLNRHFSDLKRAAGYTEKPPL